MMGGRSERREVRNPLLALPGFKVLCGLSPDTRQTIALALRAIQRDARARADECWRKHKAPMAVYWKAVGVYSGHAARILDAVNDQVDLPWKDAA